MVDLYRPDFRIHPATLGQLFLPRQGQGVLDHVLIAGVSALTYLNVWIVATDPALTAGVLSSNLAASARFDRIPIPASQPLTPVVIGAPAPDADVVDTSVPGGRRNVGGIVVSLSSGDDATGNPAAANPCTYRWIW